MSNSQEIVAHVQMMDAAESFVESDLGKTVLGMAKQDLQRAIISFDEADITNQAQIAKIQQDVRTALRFEQYLIELITRGREALGSVSSEP